MMKLKKKSKIIMENMGVYVNCPYVYFKSKVFISGNKDKIL